MKSQDCTVCRPRVSLFREAVLALLSISLLLPGCVRPPGPPSEEAASSEAGKPAPEFKLSTLDGRQLGPSDFRGKVVVVDFWATWCAPCKIQHQILRSLHQDLAGREIQFLAVNLGEDEERVRQFVAKESFPFPVLLDPDETLTAKLGIYALPTLLVIDREGKIAYLEPAIIDEERLRKVLEDAGLAA